MIIWFILIFSIPAYSDLWCRITMSPFLSSCLYYMLFSPLFWNILYKDCDSHTGRHDQKAVSPASSSSEVFYSDTSPLTSPFPTTSNLMSPPFSGKPKHSRSWNNTSPQGLKPRNGRLLSSVEESGEWADQETSSPPTTSPDHKKFYKRTRPIKDFRDVSGLKKTGETVREAKEQNLSLTKTESREVTAGRNRISHTNTKIETAKNRKSGTPQSGLQVTSALQRAEHQRRLRDSSSKESLSHEKNNGKERSLELRGYTKERQMVQSDGKKRQEPERFERRLAGEPQHLRASPRTVRENQKASSKESGQREANGRGRSVEQCTRGKEIVDKKDTEKTQSTKVSVIQPREAKGRQDVSSHYKDNSSTDDSGTSVNSIPRITLASQGQISPGPWKVPSSARILSQEEIFRDPLWWNMNPTWAVPLDIWQYL